MYPFLLKQNTKLVSIIIVVFILSGCGTAPTAKEEDSTKQSSLMVLIPAGYFTMGFDVDGNSQTYSIWLDDYYIDKYEVTNAAYQRCVNEGGCKPPPEEKELNEYSRKEYYENPAFKYYPVIYINWENANEYCNWRNARLPTEAEWQKAARGTDTRIYPWGNANPTCDFANYGVAERTCSPLPHLAQVGSHPAGVSPYGVHDLAGNVEEMVADCYIENPSNYLSENAKNPIAPENQSCRHVIHGGSFFLDGLNFLEINTRTSINPEYSSFTLGFRCAVSLTP